MGSKSLLPPGAQPAAFSSVAAPEHVRLSKVLVIVNPKSGPRRRGVRAYEKYVAPVFRDAHVDAEVKLTEACGHGYEMAKSVSLDGIDALCAMGGDGTLSEVTNGFLAREDSAALSCVLGFLPNGTGNAFMTSLGCSNLKQAACAIAGGIVKPIDAIRVDMSDLRGQPLSRHAINFIGWGLGVDANIRADKFRMLGGVRYDVATVMELRALRRRPAKVKLQRNGEIKEYSLDMMMLSAMNNEHTGKNLRLSPFAKIDDGLMDVVFNHKPITHFSEALRIFLGVKGGGKHVYEQAVAYAQCDQIELDTPTPTRVNIDGENIGMTPLRTMVVPAAFRLLINISPAAIQLDAV